MEPISQVEIEQEIIRLIHLLEEQTDLYFELLKDSAKKEATAKKDWAIAYLNHEGAVKQRESWADYETADRQFESKVADALARATKEKLYSLRTSIEGLRTLSANVRAQT